MEWSKLTKAALNRLKKINNSILLYSKDYQDPSPFDVTHFMDLKGLGLSRKDEKCHWSSLMMEGRIGQQEYDDEDFLNIFSHYLVIDIPDKN